MSLSEVEVGIREDGETLPLIVRPKQGRDSVEFLRTWISGNTSWIEQKLLEHGAILFRGFQVREAIQFQEVVQQVTPDLSDQYRGVSPRKPLPGTEYTFSASEIGPPFPIPQHLEMSFLPNPPRKIFFCCLEAPTSAGGETCLCDFKKVYEQMEPTIRDEFEEKGVMYTRNYYGHRTLFRDPSVLKQWQDVFQTDKKEEVEEDLRQSFQDFSWDKDHLRITGRETAVETHPVTGEKIWFNHAAVFHWSMFSSEFYRIYKRLGIVKYWIMSWIAWFLKLVFLGMLGPSRVGFHSSFGDGSEIPEGHLEHVRDVVWHNMVFNRWELGDVVMIDNYRISHGRQPFTGRRKIAVAWSQPQLKPSRQAT